MYRPELIVGGIIGNECLLLREMRSAWGKICSSNSMSYTLRKKNPIHDAAVADDHNNG
jgi:hypothetical protein